MDDLVSRQTALDMLDMLQQLIKKEQEAEGPINSPIYFSFSSSAVKRFIEKLPSVQSEIIKCKDCDYWNERQGRMYCGEMYFDQDDPNFYCGYAKRKIDE